ncbi:MAG TPA: zf-HC2 domain-containing protein [Gaiellaceae bacterium]
MNEPGHLCERARFWASLRLDGELSELEGALLEAHLARCAGCRAVADGFGASATALRSAPLERVAPVAVDLPRTPRRLLATIAVAAVLVLGAIAGGVVRGQASHDAASAPRAVAVVASFETPDQLRRLRRATFLNTRRLPRDVAVEPV